MSAIAPPETPPNAPTLVGDAASVLRAMRRSIAALRVEGPTNRGSAPRLKTLDSATARAAIGEALPAFDNLGLLRRILARAVGRVVLYFLRLVTADQSQFNRLIARALSELAARSETEAAALRESVTALRDQQVAVRRTLDQVSDATAWLQTETAMLRRRTQITAATTVCFPPMSPAPPTASSAGSRPTDPGRIAEAFRTGEPERREYQRQYLPLFLGRRDVLDVGCGRGEFLDLLREVGVPARGIDADPDKALRCQEKGLDVSQADALEYLTHVPSGSLGGIFCSQVIEHLTSADMLQLIELAARALQSGGVLVVETLNPESLLVLYRWFWADLTHQRLVHPETLKLIFEAAGLREVTIRYMQPPEGPLRLPVLGIPTADPEQMARFNSATQYLNDLLYGSFEFAVVGVR